MHRLSTIVLAILSLLVIFCFSESNNEVPTPSCGATRSYSGECNNLLFREWGKSGNYLKRGAEGVRWADAGTHMPVLTPNMRTVSNNLFRADDNKRQEDGLNLLWSFFGQFITHDLSGVNRQGDNGIDLAQPANNSEIYLLVPLEQSNDMFFTAIPPINVPYLKVLRSRGDVVNGVFQVGSESTSYLDLDTVYGKNDDVARLLRKYSGGELQYRIYDNYTAIQGVGFGAGTIPGDLVGNYGEWMPLVEDVDPDRTFIPISPQLVPSFTQNITARFFATGEGRNGENYSLNTIHGLFLREHNRIARQTAAAHPHWSDEQIFQHARNLNIAQYQAIVLYEFLPSLLGNDYNQVGNYEGYDMWVDPQVSHLFTFSFRFGHSTVPEGYILRNKCGGPYYNSSRDGPRTSQAASIFMPADQMAQNGAPENVIHGLLFEGCRPIDLQFPEQLRTIAFGANTDITVQNQMRAADNGVPDYNTIRKLWHGGPFPSVYDHPECHATESSPSPDPLACWLVFTANVTAASRLRDLYGKLTNLNFYTAVVGEDPTHAVVGQTSSRIIADQFKRCRDGDRWWFENEDNGMFTRQEANEIKRTTLSVLFNRNFPTAAVPDAAFYVPRPRFFRHCHL